MNFKEIHIGKMLQNKVVEQDVKMPRICKFLKISEEEILEMYHAKSIDTEILLKWSKILDYDFFRIYTQHLIFYAPTSAEEKSKTHKSAGSSLPQFRKSIYTKEVIDFVLEQINSKAMSKAEVMDRYRIPKTTLYKWISKYGNKKQE